MGKVLIIPALIFYIMAIGIQLGEILTENQRSLFTEILYVVAFILAMGAA